MSRRLINGMDLIVCELPGNGLRAGVEWQQLTPGTKLCARQTSFRTMWAARVDSCSVTATAVPSTRVGCGRMLAHAIF